MLPISWNRTRTKHYRDCSVVESDFCQNSTGNGEIIDTVAIVEIIFSGIKNRFF